MAKKKQKVYCGVGGQAVLDGIMMKKNDDYSIAVRKSDGTIDIVARKHESIVSENKFKNIPFLRGVFNFVDSLVLGTKALNHSANVAFEDEAQEPGKFEKFLNKKFGEKAKDIMLSMTMTLSVVLAILIFMVLPYGISALVGKFIKDAFIISVIEAVFRIVIFMGYIILIGRMEDIQKVYQYHGAEHKCINCLEKGHRLTVENVMRASRLHKRCGTSFLLYVMVISCILFFFITTPNPILRLVYRLLLIPVIAGVSYEIIRLAGTSNNFLVNLLSKPGFALQLLTTKEPEPDMAFVAIKAVEAVCDWRAYLIENGFYTKEEIDELEDDSDEVKYTIFTVASKAGDLQDEASKAGDL